MKYLFRLALILSLVNTPSLLANIYRVDFNYDVDDDGESGELSGFMTLNLGLGDGLNQIQQDLGVTSGIPDWITSISLTYDPDPDTLGDETTTTSFAAINWDLNQNSLNKGFDVTSNFVPQMEGFGFFTEFGGDYFISTDVESGATFDQQHSPSSSEFPLISTATTPGGLPLLGLAALAIYYKKIKSNNYEL